MFNGVVDDIIREMDSNGQEEDLPKISSRIIEKYRRMKILGSQISQTIGL